MSLCAPLEGSTSLLHSKEVAGKARHLAGSIRSSLKTTFKTGDANSREFSRIRLTGTPKPSNSAPCRCSLPDLASATQDAITAVQFLPVMAESVQMAQSALSSVQGDIPSMSLAVGVGLPCTVMDCGDHIYRSTLPSDDSLKLTLGGASLLLTVGAYLWSTPGVAPGFWDMFVLAPFERVFNPKIKKADLTLGRKLGEGGYGAVYRAQFVSDPDSQQLVVKRANDFGAVEIWMNERVRRACPDTCASFISGFVDKNKYSEDFWLVWEFEGDSTFAKIIESKDFPYNVEKAVLGKVAEEPKSAKREMKVIRALMKRILYCVEKLHSIGIVHRDMKPQNMIFNSQTGALKIIDLGAAADLRVGINFNPNEFLLDPRFAAPEQYIMSTQTPKAPPPPIAATLSPVLWQMNLPDRFDMYSCGLIFLQMCFAPLRSDSGIIAFNRQLKRCEYDLTAWREMTEQRGKPEYARGFELLDMNGGLGWQLVQAMMRFKPRQRISAAGALTHPFFDPASIPFLQRVRLEFLRLIYRDNSDFSSALVNYIARSGTPSVGGFTEMSLQKFRRDERKKQVQKETLERNLRASALLAQRKVVRTINSTVGGESDGEKQSSWWNRWQSARSLDSKL